MVQNHPTREQETHTLGDQHRVVAENIYTTPPPPTSHGGQRKFRGEGGGGPKGGNLRGVVGGFSSLFFPGAPSKIDEQIIVFIDDLLSMIFYLQSA